MARVRWRRRGARERQGHAPGVTPWPALPPLSGPGRAAVVAWVRKTTLCWSVADAWGLEAAAASEMGKRAGVGDVRLTRGAKWQRQLAGLLGARASSSILGRLAGP